MPCGAAAETTGVSLFTDGLFSPLPNPPLGNTEGADTTAGGCNAGSWSGKVVGLSSAVLIEAIELAGKVLDVSPNAAT